MARRRGSFGRRRGRPSSIAQLVISLQREERAARDRVMFDAYNNGGKVDGKVVDDQMFLGYLKQRRNGFKKGDDPEWDEWNNRYIQQSFTIDEQEIGLKFQEGKVSAGAVANFYRQQLKKLPKDSPLYREIAGRAAQWAKSAVSAARGRARARATGGGGGGGRGGLRGQLNAEIQKGAQYLALEQALTDYATRIGVISPGDKLTDADATDLREMFNQGIYTDAKGQDRLTFSEFTSAATSYYKSLDRQVQLQVQLGNQGVEARSRRDRHLYGTLLKLNAVDDRAGYELLRERWLSDIEEAAGDPYAIAEANKKYSAGLRTIYGNATKDTDLKANDPEFVGGIVNEITAIETGKAKGKTVAQMFGEEDDAEQTAKSVSKLAEDMKLLDSGKAYYGQTEPGGQFGVVKWPEGMGGDPLGLDDSLQPSLKTINGVRRVVYLKGKEITSSVIYDTQSGQAVPFDPLNMDSIRQGIRSGQYQVREGRKVGYTFTDPRSGQRTYGIPDPVTGKMVFTTQNPFTSDIIGVGGQDMVFSPGFVLDDKDDPIPDATKVFRQPVSLATGGSPILSDSTVAAKDLLVLLNQGKIDVDEDQIAQYRARLERDARNAAGEMARDRSYEATYGRGVGGSFAPIDTRGDSPSEIARDARAAFQLPNVQSLRPSIYALFGIKDETNDKQYVPPPIIRKPPTPVAPKPPFVPKPPSAPKPVVKPAPKPSPKLPPGYVKDDQITPSQPKLPPGYVKDDVYVPKLPPGYVKDDRI